MRGHPASDCRDPWDADPAVISLLGGASNESKQALENIQDNTPGEGPDISSEGRQEGIEDLCCWQAVPVRWVTNLLHLDTFFDFFWNHQEENMFFLQRPNVFFVRPVSVSGYFTGSFSLKNQTAPAALPKADIAYTAPSPRTHWSDPAK